MACAEARASERAIAKGSKKERRKERKKKSRGVRTMWTRRYPQGTPTARIMAICRLALLVHMPSRLARVSLALAFLSSSVYLMCSRIHVRIRIAFSRTLFAVRAVGGGVDRGFWFWCGFWYE